jgi:hypothetical protein
MMLIIPCGESFTSLKEQTNVPHLKFPHGNFKDPADFSISRPDALQGLPGRLNHRFIRAVLLQPSCFLDEVDIESEQQLLIEFEIF